MPVEFKKENLKYGIIFIFDNIHIHIWINVHYTNSLSMTEAFKFTDTAYAFPRIYPSRYHILHRFAFSRRRYILKL